MDKPALGVCYYPEHWPQSQWESDAALMVASGIRWVRVGEFAWSRIEPEPGQLQFGWLDQALAVLGKAGLKVVLGTPTATPPRWLLDKYPDMLAIGRDGQARGFGSRRHYDFSHAAYRQEAARIAGIMAARYAAHPAVQFWQTDNEYSCHDTTLSYSLAARDGFQAWLAARYGTVQALNQAWGNVFWSMEYRDFREVGLPNQTVTEANPSHWHDFRRYASAQVVLFNRAQVEAIRAHDPLTPILHNYMGLITDFDHFAVGKDLQAASWDSYPLGFLEDRVQADADWKRHFMRQGDPDFQAFHHDLYRAVGRGQWWVMEQQPGPVNWAPYNPAPLPGMVRLWTWEAFAHGAAVVSYFRWRQAPFAQEQMHAGLLRPDSQPAPGLAEVQQVAAELAAWDVPTSTAAPIALVFDYESAWAWETQPQGKGFSYFQLLFAQYRALRCLGLSVDICPPDTPDFSAYRLVIVSGLMHWHSGLQQALQTCAGTVLLGPRTGSKTADFQIPSALPPDYAGLALKVTHVESLRPDVGIAIQGGGEVQHWREFLESRAGVETLWATEAGEPVVVQQGNTLYCAGWLDAAGYQRLFAVLCAGQGIKTVLLPNGLRLRQMGQQVLAFNYGATAVSLAGLARLYRFAEQELAGTGVAFGDVVREA